MVYFKLVTPSGNPPRIKIGFTEDYQKRLKQHRQAHLGVKFDVLELCVVRGTTTHESSIHAYFAAHRIPDCKDDFWPTDELVGYIRWLRDQHWVWVPDDPLSPPLEQLEEVGFDLWQPTPGRHKSPPVQNGLFPEHGPLNLPARAITGEDYYTPPAIIEAARLALGGVITLDPASHAVANRVVRAERIFTQRDNGLERDWSGTVWLNPPYCTWEQWGAKLLLEWNKGNISAMCALAACRTQTAQYFHPVLQAASSMFICRERLPFWGPLARDPDDGHFVLYFGTNCDDFKNAFASLGKVF